MLLKFVVALTFSIFCYADTIEINITDTPKDIKVPNHIWDLLNSGAKTNLLFVPIAVSLKEKTQGVLIAPEIHIQLPRGGGEIDLAHYVKEKQGTFFVNFEFPEETNKDLFQAFFVSQNKKRKMDGIIHGSGCNSFYDIKDYIINVRNKKGIEVNTTQFRYLSVLAGHFIFALTVNKDTQLAQVSFTNSNKPEYLCPSRSVEIKKREKENASTEGL